LTHYLHEATEFTRVYLAVFFTAVALFYTVRILVLKKRYQNDVIFPGARFCSSWWTHSLFRVFRATIWTVCVFRCFVPEIDNYLIFMPYLQIPSLMLLGNILLTLGFCTTILLHFMLGKQWRSGIDPEKPTQLITDGFYRFTRNPMFLAIGLSQLGFFMAIPSVFSAICLVIGFSCLAVQTSAEEKHLARLLPNIYNQYCQKVRRWI
jgi:protein-S-isoprenylcysteine O-methyltransferase Ste14